MTEITEKERVRKMIDRLVFKVLPRDEIALLISYQEAPFYHLLTKDLLWHIVRTNEPDPWKAAGIYLLLEGNLGSHAFIAIDGQSCTHDGIMNIAPGKQIQLVTLQDQIFLMMNFIRAMNTLVLSEEGKRECNDREGFLRGYVSYLAILSGLASSNNIPYDDLPAVEELRTGKIYERWIERSKNLNEQMSKGIFPKDDDPITENPFRGLDL